MKNLIKEDKYNKDYAQIINMIEGFTFYQEILQEEQ